MGELIHVNFGRPREAKGVNLGINPSDEPGLFKLSPEELVQTALERELTLKRHARSHTGQATDFEADMTAAIRVSELLTPEQLQSVYYTSEQILLQERQK